MTILKLFLVTDPDGGYMDSYDSFVVVSASEDMAKLYNPKGHVYPNHPNWHYAGAWCNTPERVTVQYLGIATPREFVEGEIILSSFNAG